MFSYIQEAKICETFLYTKIQTLFKKQVYFRYVFIYKKQDTLRYTISHEFLKLVLLYKKHHTLCCVTYSYTKRKTIRKKQDSLRYIFTYKNLATLRYAIFH